MPIIMPVVSSRVPTDTENAARRNRERSISGAARPRWRSTKTTPKTTPAARLTAGSASKPLRASSLTPYMAGRIAASDSPTLSRSSLAPEGSLYSGSRIGPVTSSSTITGTAIRKGAPHQKWSSSRPPAIGPTTPPTMKDVVQMVTAVVLSFGSRNMLRSSDSVDGASVAAEMPSSARAAISISALLASAVSTEATPKNTAPVSSSRRRPMRSPRVPMVIRKPAMRKP